MSLLTECFSMNSLISMRTKWSSLSNKNPASALQSSVFPTPVGPKNRNEPVGREGSLNPARLRRMALDTATMASSPQPVREAAPPLEAIFPARLALT